MRRRETNATVPHSGGSHTAAAWAPVTAEAAAQGAKTGTGPSASSAGRTARPTSPLSPSGRTMGGLALSVRFDDPDLLLAVGPQL
jgi:hypothetical protein